MKHRQLQDSFLWLSGVDHLFTYLCEALAVPGFLPMAVRCGSSITDSSKVVCVAARSLPGAILTPFPKPTYILAYISFLIYPWVVVAIYITNPLPETGPLGFALRWVSGKGGSYIIAYRLFRRRVRAGGHTEVVVLALTTINNNHKEQQQQSQRL